MLFTVNRSPFTTESLRSCLRFAGKDSPILLYEDGVYGAQAGTALEASIKDALKARAVYALKEDLAARGIDKLIEGVRVVDYAGFVDLVAEHNVCPWI